MSVPYYYGGGGKGLWGAAVVIAIAVAIGLLLRWT